MGKGAAGQKVELKYEAKYVRKWMEVGNTVQGTVTYRTVEQAMQYEVLYTRPV